MRRELPLRFAIHHRVKFPARKTKKYAWITYRRNTQSAGSVFRFCLEVKYRWRVLVEAEDRQTEGTSVSMQALEEGRPCLSMYCTVQRRGSSALLVLGIRRIRLRTFSHEEPALT